MHSFYEINELRKRGDAQTAYSMTKEVAEEEPDCLWVYNLQATCIVDLLNSCAVVGRSDAFLDRLQEFANIGKEHNLNGLTVGRVIWPVRAFVADSLSSGVIYDNALNRLFAILQQIDFDTTDKNYGVLLGAFLKAKNKTRMWGGLRSFIEWWNLDNIQDKDCEPFQLDNGKKIMSLAEQAYIAYAKLLLADVESHKVDVAVVEMYVAVLDSVTRKHPEFMYPPYYEAKLLLAIGHNEEAVKVLLPFAQMKSKDFWVWQLLGDAVQDEDLRFSCYCKALTCYSKDDMLCKLHLKMCDMLVARNLYNEARTELDSAIAIYNRKQWHLPYEYQDYTQEQWYINAVSNNNNNAFYIQHVFDAEELMFADKALLTIVVAHVDKNAHKAYFSTIDRQKGSFMTDRLPRRKQPSVGDVLKCRMECVDGRWKLYTIEKVEDCGEYEGVLVKHIKDRVHVKDSGIGFVKDVFVPSQILSGISNGDVVEIAAVLSYNKMKSVWGWTAVKINKE